MEEMLAALENLSLLETLELVDTLPSVDGVEVPAVTRKVTLPCLHAIKLDSSAIDCAYLLHHLALPTDTTVLLICYNVRGIVDLVSCLSTKILCGPQKLHTLCIERIDYQYRIQCYVAEASEGVARRVTGPRKKIDLTFPDCDGDGERFLPAICASSPLSDVQELVLSNMWYTDLEVLGAAFGQMEKLSVLQVKKSTDEYVFEALRPQRPEDFTSRCLFPRLQVLKLKSVQMDEFNGDHELEMGEILAILRDCLTERRNHNAAEIKELALVACADVHEKEMNSLREVAESIMWDGVRIMWDGVRIMWDGVRIMWDGVQKLYASEHEFYPIPEEEEPSDTDNIDIELDLPWPVRRSNTSNYNPPVASYHLQ
ncbi:hypothetical protein AcV7_010247 [Taiwanofungus camphoratus]|nr:hypothetical protein AcV7_010247 [Antrodia cinnamomea]